MDLQAQRREYLKGGLTKSDLVQSPIEMFSRWMQDALDMQLPDASAMTLASVGSDGQPSQRIVLLKSVDEAGFVFFTNYSSRKGEEIAANAKISLHFPWHAIERQVSVCGVAEKISAEESQKYFSSRPIESQLAALASQQSRPLESKEALIAQFKRLKERFVNDTIPLPPTWGGYRVRPHEIEFWQGGAYRLHDRFVYRLQANAQWQIQQLAP